ncbi:MAG: hypothetical protein JW762_05565 [Dehalococcoidales bacterium]|nr:hypothetical protein [Dehalococcoidales bacterium]
MAAIAEIVSTSMITQFSGKRISLILTGTALFLWSLSLIYAELNIGFYGLIHSFPALFFIALSLLTLASFILWSSPQNHNTLLCFQLCWLIVMLWLTPVLIGSNSVFMDMTYSFYFSYIDYIDQFGHLNPASLWYHNWPGMCIFQSMFVDITGIKNLDVVALFGTFLMQFLVLLTLYLFFRYTIGRNNYRWAALWIFYLGNWIGQIYVSPQGMAFFLLMLLIAVLIKAGLAKEGNITVAERLKAIILISSLAVTHILTSIAGFLSIAALWVTKKTKLISILIIAAVFIIAWTMYGASTQFEYQLPIFLDRAFRLDTLFTSFFSGSNTTTSPSHTSINTLRILFSALFCVIGLGGVILSRKFKEKADSTILALAIVAILMTFTGLYTFELIMRTYMFVLIPIGYFGVKLLNSRITSGILCLVLLISLPLYVITHYGNTVRDTVPRGEIAFWHFIQDNTREGYLIGGLRPREYSYAGYYKVDFQQLEWNDNVFTSEYSKSDKPQYINVGRYEQSQQEFINDNMKVIPESRARLEESTHYNLIYTNRDVDLFIGETE